MRTSLQGVGLMVCNRMKQKMRSLGLGLSLGHQNQLPLRGLLPTLQPHQ